MSYAWQLYHRWIWRQERALVNTVTASCPHHLSNHFREGSKPRSRTCYLRTKGRPPKQIRGWRHLGPPATTLPFPADVPLPRDRSAGPPALTRGDAQLLGAAAKAPHHFPAAEVRQELHDAVRSGCWLWPGPQVRRSRRPGGARIPRTSRGTRAGARPAGQADVQRASRRR